MNHRSHSEETKRKISQSLMGHKLSEHTKQQLLKANLGIPRSEETKKKISRSMKGVNTWMKGKKHSKATRLKLSYMNKGDKTNFWRGGVAEKNRSLRSNIAGTTEYTLWREAVYKRDDFTCQICGARGVKIHADHIEAFTVLMRKHGVDSVKRALICTELWNVENGRTLCVPCHRKTDNYGTKALPKDYEQVIKQS